MPEGTSGHSEGENLSLAWIDRDWRIQSFKLCAPDARSNNDVFGLKRHVSGANGILRDLFHVQTQAQVDATLQAGLFQHIDQPAGRNGPLTRHEYSGSDRGG